MQRLTLTDWKTINAALAFYEAGELEEEAESLGISIDRLNLRVDSARTKVWERIERK